MAAAIILLIIPGLYVLRRLFHLSQNYLKARQLGIPVIVAPINWQDLWYGLVRPYLQWVRHLPYDLGAWIDYAHVGWAIEKSYEAHKKYGPAFVVVTAGKNEIWIDDPIACSEVLLKWKVWTKPARFYNVLTIFGKNVLTDPGDHWQRQRKIINSAFNEQSHEVVWQATIGQASQMLDSVFAGQKQNTLFQVKAAVDTLTMHVLASAIFGQDLPFQGGRQVLTAGHQKSFAEAQRWILQQFIFVVLFGEMKFLRFFKWVLPTKIAHVQPIMDDYRAHMQEFIDEVQKQNPEDVQTDNILSTMIQSNSEAKEEKLVAGGRRMYLTDEELFGNLFIMNMAGFETTASSISYSIDMLAANPHAQEWVYEEISSLGEFNKADSYGATYQASVRTMALMYETLRLHGALQIQVRISPEDQIIQVGGRDVIVPQDTYLAGNFSSVFRNPRYWGSDSLEWRPQRWVGVDASSGKEILKDAPQGTVFIPWTQGPRICPGKKFSQIEFVAAMLLILSKYRIELVEKEGESPEQARQRLLTLLSQIDTKVTPVLRNPHDAELRFVSR